MTTLTIYGVPLSNYVRTVRMALEEKGIAYELKPCPPGFEEEKRSEERRVGKECRL